MIESQATKPKGSRKKIGIAFAGVVLLFIVYYLYDGLRQRPKVTALHHNQQGVFFVQQGDYRQAEREFKAAFSLDPSYGMPLLNLADLFLEEDKFLDAAGVLKKYLTVEKDPESRLAAAARLTICYHKIGDKQAFDATLEEFIVNKRGPNDLINFSRLCLELDETNLALQILDACVTLYPDAIAAYDLFGSIFADIGRDAQALMAWKEGLKRDPQNVALINHIKEIEQLKNQGVTN